MVLVNGCDAWVDTDGGSFALSSQRYAPNVIHPDGASHITAFDLEPWPTWDFELPDGTRLRQEICAEHDTSSTIVMWTVTRSGGSVTLRVRPLVSGRDYHALHHENSALTFAVEYRDGLAIFRPYDGVPPVLSLSNGTYRHSPEWYRQFLYSAEQERGLDDGEDLASPGEISWSLSVGDRAAWVLRLDAGVPREGWSSERVIRLADEAR